MNRRKGGLGSGLEALLPASAESAGVRQLPIDSIRQNPRQPRTAFDEQQLTDLAASIREHGIIQPLIVTEAEDGGYELIAGERRWRASRIAGLATVPAIVRESTPQQLLELALIENIQRADLNPLEEARAYQSMKDEFGLSDDQIAKRIGIASRVTVTNTRRLLRLPDEAQRALLGGAISAGHGRAILKADAPALQQQLLDAIVTGELSVRDAERLGELVVETGDVREALVAMRGEIQPKERREAAKVAVGRTPPSRAKPISPDDEETRRSLEYLIGTPVTFARREQQVTIAITFHTGEKLQEFYDLLNGMT